MFDSFDPRWDDARDRHDDDERDRDDDGLTMGRGLGSHTLDDQHDNSRERDVDWREARGRDPQEHNAHDRDGFDPRDVFVRDLDLPRGHERERGADRPRAGDIAVS